jgi:DNA invertase Pin-like site-specific DNA recombinase
MHNVRFIALNDNVDTINQNSTAMDMMPIMNVFNEWHAANTSKKTKSVIEANAKAGNIALLMLHLDMSRVTMKINCLLLMNQPQVLSDVFSWSVSRGISPRHIADKLNEEKVLIPSDYQYAKLGKPNPRRTAHLWVPKP